MLPTGPLNRVSGGNPNITKYGHNMHIRLLVLLGCQVVYYSNGHNVQESISCGYPHSVQLDDIILAVSSDHWSYCLWGTSNKSLPDLSASLAVIIIWTKNLGVNEGREGCQRQA